MRDNPIQFAVVREDPEIEKYLISQHAPSGSALLVGSGGCTALSLACNFPELKLTLVDPNPNQLELLRIKTDILTTGTKQDIANAFSLGIANEQSLISVGNFESLFSGLRNFIHDFVLNHDGWMSFFSGHDIDLHSHVFECKYWPVAFKLFMSNDLLHAMFGPNAIQWAPEGSYPEYFRKIFEAGLLRDDASTNYFLHHVFLGHYLNNPHSLPDYLSRPLSNKTPFNFINGLVQDAGKLSTFDMISLSNIFDWMSPREVQQLVAQLTSEMKSGSWVIYRQLNNDSDLERIFGTAFNFDTNLANALHNRDRSLFYSSLHLGQRV